MATFLYLNTVNGTFQTVEHNSILTFAQEGVDLSAPDTDGATAQRPGGNMTLLWLVMLMVLMFILMRPRKDKEGDKFRNSLQIGQEVVNASGVFGKIVSMDAISVILEVSQNLRIRVDKRYINPVPTEQPAAPAKKSRKEKKAEENKEAK